MLYLLKYFVHQNGKSMNVGYETFGSSKENQALVASQYACKVYQSFALQYVNDYHSNKSLSKEIGVRNILSYARLLKFVDSH